MRTRHLLTLGTLLTVAASTLSAQQTTVPTFGFSVGALAIDADAAANSLVGDRAWGIQLDGGVVMHKYFVLAADLGGQFLDDHAQFSQNTTGGVKKSSASITYLSAMTGLRSGALGPLMVGLNAGGSVTMTRRSIDNCVDCQVDKLSIPGGGFVEPTVLLGRRGRFLRVTDRVYLGGKGMKSVMSIGGQFDLLKKR